MRTVDAIKEAADARAWEGLNAEDPQWDSAVTHLDKALQALMQAGRMLRDAAYAIDERPDADRILSLDMGVEDLECAVLQQIGRMTEWNFGS